MDYAVTVATQTFQLLKYLSCYLLIIKRIKVLKLASHNMVYYK